MTETTSTRPWRVLLVDDQQLLRMAFRMVIDAAPDMEVVGEAGDGREALRLIDAEPPDVVVMDVRMPVMDGIEACTQIAAHHPHVKVLVLTTFDLDEYAFAAFRAGASGFVLKNVPPEQLLEAVRTVAIGDAVVAPRVTRELIDAYTRQPAGTADDADGEDLKLALLTPREREVLVEMARGLSNAEIAAALFLSDSTIKTHIGRILPKLGLRDRVQAVVFAYESHLVAPDR